MPCDAVIHVASQHVTTLHERAASSFWGCPSLKASKKRLMEAMRTMAGATCTVTMPVIDLVGAATEWRGIRKAHLRAYAIFPQASLDLIVVWIETKKARRESWLGSCVEPFNLGARVARRPSDSCLPYSLGQVKR